MTDKWQLLKNWLEKEHGSYQNGMMMSFAESIHGENVIKQIIEKMTELEQQNTHNIEEQPYQQETRKMISKQLEQELEMHRADYQACKDAGWESPGELLAAYNTLKKQSARRLFKQPLHDSNSKQPIGTAFVYAENAEQAQQKVLQHYTSLNNFETINRIRLSSLPAEIVVIE